ncbi:hypothetical protein L3X38_036533 [Prunus dulcis]|uniref:Uncharacterized protein n=1 Tax=Prunus dulcis TaxID=3755 RepID=A0AAD4V2Z5_PRUDU|nr:hypothetical protein L3X38_036533 [Prunus dulcis]
MHQIPDESAIYIAIPFIASCIDDLIHEMTKDDLRKLISCDTELEAYHCLGEVSWFDITYHLFQASIKGQDLATKCYKFDDDDYDPLQSSTEVEGMRMEAFFDSFGKHWCAPFVGSLS